MVWHIINNVLDINKVKLSWAQLVHVLVMTFGGFSIPLFFQATQPGHPSMGRCSEYWVWFLPSLGRNDTSEVTTLWCCI